MALAAAASTGSTGFLAGLAAMRPRVRRVSSDAAHARWLADHDSLTGLPNRTAARAVYQRAAREGRPHAVVLLDLDDFKTVNDTWGHHVGDAHLVAVAERLAGSCRAIGATACRLGGDEFLLLIPGPEAAGDTAGAGDRADDEAGSEAVIRQIAEIVVALGTALPLRVDEIRTILTHPSASAGIAVATGEETFSDALRHADIALYHAKRDHLGPRLYTPELRQPSSHRHKAGDLLGLHGMGHIVGESAEPV
jgi:diguanylate cyclase (GGDEF)-like protein